MTGRSRSKNIKAGRLKTEENKFDKPECLTLHDVQCTVCMGIFVEPVTLPCFHTVCKVCFEKTIDNNTLACPLCRKYVGGWIRQRQKNGLMVNQQLWKFIQQQFGHHVEKKMKGEDDEEIDSLAELNIQAPKISEPGLIRREYEAEQKRIQEEALKRQEVEVRASEQLIKELQEREEQERRHLEDLRKKAEEEDALIAQKIAEQLAAEDARKEAEEQENLRRLLEEEEASSAFVRLASLSSALPPSQPPKKGPMDVFLHQNNLGKPTRTNSSSSTDSLNGELHHFRPVHYVATTPPKSSPDGTDSDNSQVCKPIPVMRSLDGWASPGRSSNTLRPWLKADPSSEPSTSQGEATSPISKKDNKRRRSPTGPVGKSPKRGKKESPKKLTRAQTIQTIVGAEQKNSPGKQQNEEGASDSETDCEGEFEHRKVVDSSTEDSPKKLPKSKPVNGLYNIEGTLLPLSLEDLTENEQVERRYRQEQKDYEFALQLQKELNATESQNRTYELRSIAPLTPKKNQSKIVTPRRKPKPRVAPTTAKEKRRQCTLEESMGFSVKMEL
ncbi:E3 ubiquitin-protein ligase rnf168-like [Thrips palmi]|uniref:RING-type E3 ubiquitin transferase n=1 Tax=Thrips palmi TaxID=161013 RepID=A0A6P8YEK0_THRPL|nr:E3 ubiquitin-protein ligase rnf168-like [Thrips palmi]